MTKKLRSVLSVGILVATGGLFAQAALATDFFKIDACEGPWWADFWWTKDGSLVSDIFLLDCNNNTEKFDVTRTGAATAADAYHFILFDNHAGTQADCRFNGSVDPDQTEIRKINCKRGDDLLYKGSLILKAPEEE